MGEKLGVCFDHFGEVLQGQVVLVGRSLFDDGGRHGFDQLDAQALHFSLFFCCQRGSRLGQRRFPICLRVGFVATAAAPVCAGFGVFVIPAVLYLQFSG